MPSGRKESLLPFRAGKVVAGPEADWKGRSAAEVLGLPESLHEAEHAGERVFHRLHRENREFLTVSAPIRAGEAEAAWRLWVALPLREAMAEVRSLRGKGRLGRWLADSENC